MLICPFSHSFVYPTPSRGFFPDPPTVLMADNLRNRPLPRRPREEDDVEYVDLECPHFEVCAGCILNRRLDESPKMQAAKRILPLQQIVLRESQAWRTHAKLAVGPKSDGGLKLGLFQQSSHNIQSIPKCVVHHPRINSVAAIIEAACERASITGYDQSKVPATGMLRYIVLSVERESQLVQTTLVWNADGYQKALPHAKKIVEELLRPDNKVFFHSIWFHWNDNDGNAIFSTGDGKWQCAYGPEFLHESLGSNLFFGEKPIFHFSPMIFRQANLDGFEDIVDEICKMVDHGDTICELYGGIGLVGLSVLARCGIKELRCSDQNPNNQKAFNLSLLSMDPKFMSRASYVSASAEVALLDIGEAEGANVMIVDPPRKGLGAAVLDCLCHGKQAASVVSLIYISCGFGALQKELPVLINAGWSLDYSAGFALFPGSDHVETLVLLRRGPQG